jgi:hypothetical protein
MAQAESGLVQRFRLTTNPLGLRRRAASGLRCFAVVCLMDACSLRAVRGLVPQLSNGRPGNRAAVCRWWHGVRAAMAVGHSAAGLCSAARSLNNHQGKQNCPNRKAQNTHSHR